MMKLIKQEPVLFQALIQATIALLTGFQVIEISEEQFGLLMAFTAALLGVVTRKVVTPLANPKDNEGNTLKAEIKTVSTA